MNHHHPTFGGGPPRISVRGRIAGFFTAVWQTWVRGRWRRRFLVRSVERLVILLAMAYALYLVWAVVGIVIDRSWGPDPERACRETTTECSAAIGTISSVLALAAVTAIFLVWRLTRAKRPVRRKAKTDARNYVPTATNSILEDVVGRDELCRAINDELKDRRTRRPHLLVGGVGAGKTAVMVRLTELLAHQGAIPVPIRLREVEEEELDFEALARKKFSELVDEELLVRGVTAKAMGDQAWRWLRKEDRVVVLADGLEEVFAGQRRESDRDNLIRRGIRAAGERHLPLVIASRPHAPLRDVEASVTELEPLSEEAALAYIEGETRSEDEHRLDWIVERAEVSEAPLYLQVARQLYNADRLEHVVGRRDEEETKLNTRETDRAGLRFRLLRAWTEALCDGHLMEELALKRRERREAVAWISALACLGLQHDTIQVPFHQLVGGRDECSRRLLTRVTREVNDVVGPHGQRLPQCSAVDSGADRHDEQDQAVLDLYLRRLQLAATWGEQLRLVEAHGNHVRFQHSLMQAYLGSRCLGTALAEGTSFLRDALDPRPRPGPTGDGGDSPDRTPPSEGPSRELLISLVFLSRDDRAGHRVHDGAPLDTRRLDEATGQLVDAAENRCDEKALDLYAAALELDRVLGRARHRTIVDKLEERWWSFDSQDRSALLDAKFNLVHRLGDALRSMVDDHEPAVHVTTTRVASTSFTDTDITTTSVTATDVSEAGTGTIRRPPGQVAGFYRNFFAMGVQEPTYRVRLAIAEEIGQGGTEAVTVLEEERDRRAAESMSARIEHEIGAPAQPRAADHAAQERQRRIFDERSEIMRAWLTPMLFGSVPEDDETGRQDVRRVLRAYTDAIRLAPQGSPVAAGKALVQEIALAQGFKAAANRRVRHPASTFRGRAALHEHAEELLRASSFWYTHVTLVQALSLWTLPDSLPSTVHETAKHADPRQNRSARARVDRWLSLAGRDVVGRPLPQGRGRRTTPNWPTAGWWHAFRERRRLHPFLREAGKLAVRALETQRPERYLWIDEQGVANQVGSRPSDPTQRRVHNLWIPPSTGWTALHRRAERLVADILLLLQLTGRGDPDLDPDDHARYLERANRPDLPLCLTGDRRPLRPTLSVAKPGRNDPGSGCADGCPFELCPHPPRGSEEVLGEAFCRRQLTTLSYATDPGPHRRSAPWQRAPVWTLPQRRTRLSDVRLRNLRRFWQDMADRRIVARDGRSIP